MPPPPPTDGNGNILPPPTDESGNMMQPPFDPNGNGMQPPFDPNGNGMQPPFDPNNGSALSIAEGDEVSILDANGKILYSVTSKRSASFVFLSSSELVDGDTYSLTVNGAEVAQAQAGKEANFGGFGGRPENGGKNGQQDPANTAGTEQTGSSEKSGSKRFSSTIIIVATAAVLIAAGCITALAVLGSKYRKKLASLNENDKKS